MSNMLNISINGAKRTKISVNGDTDKVIELNLADMGIVSRMKAAIPRITEAVEAYKNVEMDADDETLFYTIADTLGTLDDQIKKEINYIFDYDVCEVILGGMSSMSLTDDGFVFTEVIEKLQALYVDEIGSKMQSLNGKIKANVKKYTKKK